MRYQTTCKNIRDFSSVRQYLTEQEIAVHVVLEERFTISSDKFSAEDVSQIGKLGGSVQVERQYDSPA